ncbi:MAG: hypothetical protein CO096_09965 [Armatimonadetes bacterium CG_4_9_14_3_um_filter_66_14]|nr:MAG: hypothetical protein CO096_09965 [Armatimonadetes bacterium CG_4_9_14_3_um_filter_66_14]
MLETILAKGGMSGRVTAELRLKLAYMYDSCGRSEEALQECEKVLTDFPDDRDLLRGALLRKGWVLSHAERLEESEAVLQAVIRRFDGEPRTVATAKADIAIHALWEREWLREGVRVTQEARQGLSPSDPLFATLRLREGQFLEGLGSYEAALRVYESVPMMEGSDPHLNAGWETIRGQVRCDCALGRVAEAKSLLAKLQEAREVTAEAAESVP